MPGPWDRYAAAQNVAPNPMFPGQQQLQGQQIQQNAATLPYAAPKARADAANAATQAGVNAATAPAEITSKNATARKNVVEAQQAEQNFATTGGANEGQAKSAGFFNRALKANQMYEGTGIKDEPQGHALALTLLPDNLVNQFTSPARQKAEAAQRDFISATLRYESGAAISPQEFENQRRNFFPMPGDSPETIAAKQQLRQNAIDALRVSAGPAGPVAVPDQSIATGATATEADPQASAMIDALVRQGVPYGKALRQLQQQFPGATPISAAEYNQAVQYHRRNPAYKGSFGAATKTRPTTLGERVSASPLGAGLAAAGDAATLGFSDELAGLMGADQNAFNNAKQQLAEDHPIANIAGTAAGSLAPMGIANRFMQATNIPALIGPGKAATLADIGTGAAFGAGESNDNRLLGAGLGAGAAGAGNLAGRGIANTLGALVSPTGGKLANLYEMGVRPSIGQRAGGLVNNFEEKLQSVPFLGDAIEGTRQRARDQFQIGLFNDALGEIGQSLPKGMKPGHDPHAFAQKAFNQAYDAAKSNMTAAADNGLATDLGALQRTVGALKPDSQNTFNKLWADSVARRFQGGNLSGPAFKDATSEIEKRIAAIRNSQSGDGELADVLQEAVDALKSSASRNSPPEAVAAMDAADRGYAKLVQLEDASKRAGGDAATFTPKQFEAAVKNTSSGVRKRSYLAGKALNSDLAESGLSLSDVVSNSGTIDRLLPATALIGTGFIEPKSAAVLGLYGLANAPGVRNLTTSLMAPRGGKARTIADLIRQQSGLTGTIGSGVGIGLLPSR